MLNVDRQKIILDHLYQKGSVKVSKLSEELGVHEETIRRDLKSLASNWDIELVYGGAVLNRAVDTPSVQEQKMQAKRERNYDAKQLLAKKAAALIRPYETIGLNSGSTVEYILDYLEDKKPLNIVTLNVHIASKALLMDDVEVYLPGGKAWKKSGSMVGSGAAEFIKSFTIDRCFCGVSAISIGKGISHPNLEEVECNRAMVEASTKSYVVSDSSKLNQNALFKMFNIEDVDAFIVDEDFPNDYKEYMEMHGIEII